MTSQAAEVYQPNSVGGGGMTAAQIPCCLCGQMIFPNAANQCGSCLAQQFDLKAMLQRGPGGGDIILHQCRQCRRYERPNSGTSKSYEELDPESPELLSLCLKQIPALHSKSAGGHGTNHSSSSTSSGGGVVGGAEHSIQRLHLVDAMWVWTEPHSMRLKVRLTIRAELNESPRTVTIQQRVLVEIVVAWKQCAECNREYTNRTWHAIVQLRQKRSDDAPRKGLILLEMALAKNADIRKHVLSMETTRHGFDFYFHSLVHAQQFSSYVSNVAPMRIKTTKKLVSTDVKNNTANMKYTVVCDMVPLCRDDLIICDKRGAREGGGAGRLSGRLCLVLKMSNTVHLVDAAPARSVVANAAFADLHPEKYWKAGGEKSYRVLFTSRRMVRFVVLDVELCSEDADRHHQGGGDKNEEEEGYNGNGRSLYSGPHSGIEKYALADVEVARESDFGQNDETFRCVTHLGNLLDVGDVVLGYDLVSSVLPSDAEWSMENSVNSSFVMPDVVLVKKVKGGGASEGDGGAEQHRSNKTEKRAKSSASKKRERRKRKEEKKMKALEEAAARMGFLDDDEEAHADAAALEGERTDFERELERDPELARELALAEQELAKRQIEAEDEDEILHDTEASDGMFEGNASHGQNDKSSQIESEAK